MLTQTAVPEIIFLTPAIILPAIITIPTTTIPTTTIQRIIVAMEITTTPAIATILIALN